MQNATLGNRELYVSAWLDRVDSPKPNLLREFKLI